MFELICKHCKKKFSSRRRRALKGGHMQYAHKSLAFDSDVAAATWSSINDHHASVGGIDNEKSEQFNWSNRHDGDARSSLLNKFDGNNDDRAVFESIYVQALSYRIKLNSSSSKIRKICKKEWSRLSKISDELPEERDEGRGEADDDEEDCDDNDCQEDASIKETAISASFYSNIAEHGGVVCSVGDNAYDQTIMKTAKPLNSHNKADHIPLYSLKSRDPKLSKRFVDDREYAMETASHASALVAPSTTKSSSSNDLPSDKAHACTECRREFSSRKALFGHMRCHPEREWRGIHRPILHIDQENPCKIKKSPSPCEESDEILSAKLDNQANSDDNVKAENIDVSFMNGESKISIGSWMRGKRSKRPRQVVRSLKMVTDNASKLEAFNASSGANEETDMANCLVLLAACASRDQTQAPPPLKKMKKTALILSTEIIDRRLHDRHKMISSDPDVSVNRLCQRKDQIAMIKPNFKVNAQNQSVCEGLPEGGADIEQEEGCDVEAGKAKHHECPTCKRMFKSHQALGGHRASHKKVKGCFARTAGPTELSTEEEEVTEEDLLRSLKTERIISASGSTHGNQIKNYEKEITRSCRSKKPGSIRKKLIKGHECSICYCIFPSGQALGGHKRCHWGRAGSFETSIIPVSSPSHSHSHSHSQQKHPSLNHGFQRRGPEELQLDLNLPAPEEGNENFYMDERSSNSAPHLNFE